MEYFLLSGSSRRFQRPSPTTATPKNNSYDYHYHCLPSQTRQLWKTPYTGCRIQSYQAASWMQPFIVLEDNYVVTGRQKTKSTFLHICKPSCYSINLQSRHTCWCNKWHDFLVEFEACSISRIHIWYCKLATSAWLGGS